MFRQGIMFLLAAGAAASSLAQTSTVNELFQADVGDVSNQEIVMLEVSYPPGVESASHRHNAHTVVYVLEGTVIMQVAGGERKTLTAGQVFYETPKDIHSVSMNS
jgi:quercetin dioxygenase-like cupin family protein